MFVLGLNLHFKWAIRGKMTYSVKIKPGLFMYYLNTTQLDILAEIMTSKKLYLHI